MSDAVFTHDVFLSHSSKDKAVVRAVAERLRADGLRVWFDECEIQPGDNIPAKIEDGLEHSRVLACPDLASGRRRMLCMSANAFGSDWALLACPTVASGRRRKAGTFCFRDPLNSAFADRLRQDKQERGFIPLRLDDAPVKGALEQFVYIDWLPRQREREYAQLLETRRDKGGKARIDQTALLTDPHMHLSAEHAITTKGPISDS